MGWASGTNLFDTVMELLLGLTSQIVESVRIEAVRNVIDAFEDNDWDCFDESRYADHPIVKKAFRGLHPDLKE